MKTARPTIKRLLCFGDSNTWGYVPATTGERYEWKTRWPGVVQQKLGSDYAVIEEALNGRTTVWDDPMKPDRNGSKQLPIILETHTPIDLVIIALGVNDLTHHFHLNAIDIALGVGTLAEIVIQSRDGVIYTFHYLYRERLPHIRHDHSDHVRLQTAHTARS